MTGLIASVLPGAVAPVTIDRVEPSSFCASCCHLVSTQRNSTSQPVDIWEIFRTHSPISRSGGLSSREGWPRGNEKRLTRHRYPRRGRREQHRSPSCSSVTMNGSFRNVWRIRQSRPLVGNCRSGFERFAGRYAMSQRLRIVHVTVRPRPFLSLHLPYSTYAIGVMREPNGTEGLRHW